MSEPYIPAIVKDFHVLYRAAQAAMKEETWSAREGLLAQLERLRPLFEECEAVRRGPAPWSDDALDDYVDRSKYDAEILALRKNLQAGAVVLVVLHGKRGTGGGVAVDSKAEPAYRQLMPTILRDLADDIERGTTESAVRLEWEDNADGN